MCIYGKELITLLILYQKQLVISKLVFNNSLLGSVYRTLYWSQNQKFE